MLTTWDRWLWISGSPFYLFIVFLILSHLVYYFFLRSVKPTMMTGAIVMALAIFAMTCLPNFDFVSWVVLVFALELLIIWFYIAFELAHVYMLEEVKQKGFSTKLALGTWAAGTALLASLLDFLQPTLHGFIILLGMVAIVLWVAYFFTLAQWFYTSFTKSMPTIVNGMVFLPAISTQCMVMLIDTLFGKAFGDWFYESFIILGYLFYVAGFIFLLWYFIKQDRQTLKWSPANTMIYSAMALCGLAVINLNTEIPLWIIHVTWYWVVLSFVIVMGIEIYRWVRNAQNQSTRKDFFEYRTSQWLRVFSICAFYGFAWSYYHVHYNERFVLAWIPEYGHYIVMIIYLIEAGILVNYFILYSA